jgi:DNA-binding transcriptional regulator YiaG
MRPSRSQRRSVPEETPRRCAALPIGTRSMLGSLMKPKLTIDMGGRTEHEQTCAAFVRVSCILGPMTVEAEIRAYYEREMQQSREAAPKWEFSDRVRKIRRLQKMTQDDFAEAVDVPPGTLRSWEAGASEPGRTARLTFAVQCQARFGTPSWWTVGMDGPADIFAESDPKIAATARLLVLEQMMADQSRKLPLLDSNQQPVASLRGGGQTTPRRRDHLALVAA